MNNYNIKELRKKIEKCKNICLNEVNPDDVDELSSIKINTRMNPVNRIIAYINNQALSIKTKLINLIHNEYETHYLSFSHYTAYRKLQQKNRRL